METELIVHEAQVACRLFILAGGHAVYQRNFLNGIGAPTYTPI